MKIAVIRVRGTVDINPKMRHTLDLLKLHKKNWLTFVDNDEKSLGMLKVIKDWATYGEVDLETFKEVLKKHPKSLFLCVSERNKSDPFLLLIRFL